MGDWDDPMQRAAVWYLAAFAGLVSVLLAGFQLSGFVWSKALHPWLAALSVCASVIAAVTVVMIASSVIAPAFTLNDLKDRQRKAEAAALREADQAGWREQAGQDRKVLEPLYALDGFDGPRDSPIVLSRDAGSDPDKAKRANEMVAAANRRATQQRYRLLRFAAPVATGVVLATALAWSTLSRKQEEVASTMVPVPVELTLPDDVEPTQLFGADCDQRTLNGVAISGSIKASPLVAFPEQGNCRSALVRVTERIGSVARLPSGS